MTIELFAFQITWKLWVLAGVSGLCAGIVTMFVTWSIQRYGGLIGGVIATLPSSIVPTALGLALTLTGDDEDYTIALYCVPVGVMLNAMLLVLWRVLLPRLHFHLSHGKRIIVMCIISLLAWMAVATLLGIFLSHMIIRGMTIRIPALISLGISCIIWVIVAIVGVSIGAKGEGRVSARVYFFGAIVGGISAFCAITLAAFSDVASGLAISFPAVLLTSMVALSLSHSDSLPVSATTSMIGGMLSIAVYAIVIAELLEPLDNAMGGTGHWGVAILASVIDWILCVTFVSLPVGLVIRWREKASKRSIGRIVLGASQDSMARYTGGTITPEPRPSRQSSMIYFRQDNAEDGASESPTERYFSTTPVSAGGSTFMMHKAGHSDHSSDLDESFHSRASPGSEDDALLPHD